MPALVGYAFGPYELRIKPLALLRAGVPVLLSPRKLAILHALVSFVGQIVRKMSSSPGVEAV